jgi:hypothetical protein
MSNSPIHYAIGRGLPKKLAKNIDYSVFKAFHEASRKGDLFGPNRCEIDVRSVGVTAELWWDKGQEFVCMYLELVQTDQRISEEEWGDCEGEPPRLRPIN